MPVKFLGQDAVIYLQDYLNAGDIRVLTCRRTSEYERSRETIETTTLDGYEVGHVLGIKRGRFSANCLSIFNEYGEDAANDEQVRQWFEDGTLLYIMIMDAKDGEERVLEFYGYIERWRITRNNNEGAGYDLDIVQTQPSSYDIPVLACPIVTANPDFLSIALDFSGVAGTTYTFTCVENSDVVTVTDNPWQAEFTGLDPDTTYTFTLEVSQAGAEPLTCDNITASTDAALSAAVFGGASKEEACSEINPDTIYYTSFIGVGSLVYEDAALTIPYNDYAFIKVAGTVYEVSAGEVVDNLGTCTEQGFNLFNNLTGSSITDVTNGTSTIPESITSGSYPVASSGAVIGQHNTFTGGIVVTITGTFVDGNLVLLKNGSFLQCLEVVGANTYTFDSATFNNTDLIVITLTEGSCA